MKSLIILSLILFGCAKNQEQESRKGNNRVTTDGVDVGNLQSKQIPNSQASILHGSNWRSESDVAQALKLINMSGSQVRFEKTRVGDIVSPTPGVLERYLEANEPGRNYEIVSINGLDGVRSDYVDQEEEKRSKLVLISELKDTIVIESELYKRDNGIEEGEQIINSVRIKYKGVAYPNPQTKTILLKDYNTTDGNLSAYSFLDDCYSFDDEVSCDNNGVTVLFQLSQTPELTVGNAGFDDGRFVLLGMEKESPFDEIRVEGEYLVANTTQTKLEDIYTRFTPKTRSKEIDRIEPVVGGVYLVRTRSWPDEDLITKIRIDSLENGELTITYQKLILVPTATLRKQVDEINKNTIENEMPLDKGEVTLYDRTHFGNYPHANFNFKYSTTGNPYITGNSWDVMLEGHDLSHPGTWSDVGEVIDIGEVNIDSLSVTDFPDPNDVDLRASSEIKLGHTYLVWTFSFEEERSTAATYGALKVLEVGPGKKWVRFQFRRIQIGAVPKFQNWNQIELPEGPTTINLLGGDYEDNSTFFPFTNSTEFSDGGAHESIEFYNNQSPEHQSDFPDTLSVDSRPFSTERGFFNLGKSRTLESVSTYEIEALRGQFSDEYEVSEGDVVAVLLENYYQRIVMVIKIEKHDLNNSVTFSHRYLERAITPYYEELN